MNAAAALLAAVLTMTALASCSGGSDPGQVVTEPEAASTGSATPDEEEQASEPAAPSESEGAGLVLQKTGFGQGEFGAYAVALFKNDSGDEGGSVSAQFTAYDASGQVVGTGEQSIAAVRAGATFALGADLDVPDGAKIARVEAVLSTSGFQTDPNPESVYTARNVRFAPSEFGGGKAQGELVSAYTSSVTDVYAQAVCFDATGTINGGGFTFVELVPAGKAVGVSIDVTTTGKPEKCDIYASLSNLSQTK